MRLRKMFFVMIIIVALLAAGCGSRNDGAILDEEELIAIPFAGYQYVKSELQRGLNYPNSAVFPALTADEITVTELDSRTLEFKGEFDYSEAVGADHKTGNYTMIIKYEGDGLWSTESLEWTDN